MRREIVVYFIFSSPGVLGGGGCMAGIGGNGQEFQAWIALGFEVSFSETVYRNLFASLQSCLET
jgi:hypothetical protein